MLEQILLRIGTILSLTSTTAPPASQEDILLRMQIEANKQWIDMQKKAEENFKKREDEAQKQWNQLRAEVFNEDFDLPLKTEKLSVTEIPIPESYLPLPRFPKRTVVIVPLPMPEPLVHKKILDPEDPISPEYYTLDHLKKREIPREIPKDIEKPKSIQKKDPIPEGSRLETLVQKQKLSGTEFQELISLVPNIKTYEAIRNRRYIYYPADGYIYEVKGKSYTYKSAPKKERREFDVDGNLFYGSPLRTHNLRHGVCDELAVHFAAFFTGKTGYKVFLFDFDPKVGEGHAVTVYQGPSGKWGFQSNLEITKEIYYSKDDALQALINKDVQFKINKIFVSELLPGKWMTTKDVQSHLRPVKRYKIRE